MVGNVQGDKGDSLVVEMNGTKVGLWHDFATGAGGDIIELWACVKNIDPKARFPEVLADIQKANGSKFAKGFLADLRSGGKEFETMRKKEENHPIEKVGKKLRSMMRWLSK